MYKMKQKYTLKYTKIVCKKCDSFILEKYVVHISKNWFV